MAIARLRPVKVEYVQQCHKPTGACEASSQLRLDHRVVVLDKAVVMPRECRVSAFSMAKAPLAAPSSIGRSASLSVPVVSLSLLCGHCLLASWGAIWHPRADSGIVAGTRLRAVVEGLREEGRDKGVWDQGFPQFCCAGPSLGAKHVLVEVLPCC